jgi:hypothetical protein
MKINEIDSSMNTTHLVSMSKIEEIINSEQCKNFNLDFNLVKGYFGERVYYSQYRDPRDSVTKPFISFGSKKIISNVIECRSELNSK